MSQFLPKQALCMALEVIINKALALDLRGGDNLSHLKGKSLSVLLTELGFYLTFSVDYSEKLLVTTLDEHHDCVMRTSVKTLRQLKQHQQLTTLIKQDLLDISGDIKVAQQFAAIAETLTIDWQSEVAKYLGDFATYKLDRIATDVAQKLKFFTGQVQADLSEWLVYEQQLLVTGEEIANYNQQVSELSQQTDALAQQLNRVAEKFNIKG